ncbi:MAG: redox-regulated ATPase YchF, partial [Magnetococcales bacterium]|nr:redox-regulated ATPase YchF [Magnetococcales bacterium]
MPLRCGIVGLPNVGKSTIFNALTSAGAEMANYPFCTIEPNVGVVAVPDARMERLNELIKPQRLVPTTVEFVDIAGLVKGASQGEGLGNQFLGHIRQVDAIAHVVRCFIDDDITHVQQRVNPADDIQVIDTELMLADLESVRKRHDMLVKKARSGDRSSQELVQSCERLLTALDQGIPIRRLTLNDSDQAVLRDLFLLTAKPVLYVCNVAEQEVATATQPGQHPLVEQVRTIAQQEGADWVVICGKIEAELMDLPTEEQQAFLTDIGLTDSGLHRMIHHAYQLLGLITYFTAGPKEVR